MLQNRFLVKVNKWAAKKEVPINCTGNKVVMCWGCNAMKIAVHILIATINER